ncbi:MAG: hypothetical protein RMK64_12505 [Rhodovarius sp.]|nr:hypothetical protein [Rhodovarius sp.]MDW8315787.1 hypothetical protein [Rhodovarius sp.]
MQPWQEDRSGRLAQGDQDGRGGARPLAESAPPARPEWGYDEGLVHQHNFACSERGRPAH